MVMPHAEHGVWCCATRMDAAERARARVACERARAHTNTHTHTHARTHARTHAHAHTHTLAPLPVLVRVFCLYDGVRTLIHSYPILLTHRGQRYFPVTDLIYGIKNMCVLLQ